MSRINAIEDSRPTSFTRRGALAVALAAGASGCSPRQSPFWGTVFGGLGSSPAAPVSIDRARALPYASMLFWFEGTTRALLVLGGRDDQDNFQWIASKRQSVSTYGPFVSQVLGTEVQLLRTTYGSGWSNEPAMMVGRTLTRSIDLQAETGKASARLTSRFHDEGVDAIEVLGSRQQLRRIAERVEVEDRARFENHYWIDDRTGLCLKSRQLAVPTMPVVNIEYVKLPRRSA